MNGAIRLPQSRTENLVVRELDDETLVYDLERNEAHCLNRTVALIWNQCDGEKTATAAARILTRKLDAHVDADLVWLAVRQLQRFHLVERVTTSPSVSRRDLVLKYAPIALALPMILSISAPTTAQAATCAGACQSCGGTFPPCCPGLSCDGICFPCGARANPD